MDVSFGNRPGVALFCIWLVNIGFEFILCILVQSWVNDQICFSESSFHTCNCILTMLCHVILVILTSEYALSLNEATANDMKTMRFTSLWIGLSLRASSVTTEIIILELVGRNWDWRNARTWDWWSNAMRDRHGILGVDFLRNLSCHSLTGSDTTTEHRPRVPGLSSG